MVDLGLRNHILSRKTYDLGFSIENVVYFELLRRGYRVNIGKYGNAEVDYVAEKRGILSYFQVTANMTSQETFEREMKPNAHRFSFFRFDILLFCIIINYIRRGIMREMVSLLFLEKMGSGGSYYEKT